MNRIENYIGIALFSILGVILWYSVLDETVQEPYFNFTYPATTAIAVFVTVICPVGFLWNLIMIFKKMP